MKVFVRSLKQALLVLALVGFTTGAVAQGNYAPVTAADLPGAKFNHYYNEKGKAVFPPDFTWSFSTNSLHIKAGKGPIPPDLLNHLAGGRKGIKEVQAGWKIKDHHLFISGILLDGEPVRTMVKLPVYRTGPTVIRIGEKQYVFSPGS